MTRSEKLKQYHAECARGIMHTPEWDEHIAELQARVEAEIAEDAHFEAQMYIMKRREELGLPHDPFQPLAVATDGTLAR